MTLVLLILAVIWAAVLIPPALRARAEGRPADSITNFHHQLAVLRRAGPRGPVAPFAGPSGAPTAASSFHAGRLHAVPTGIPVAGPPSGVAAARAAWAPVPRSVIARRNARRRRRDVLMALLVAAGTTLVVGAVPGLHFLWVVHLAADVLLFSYVGLLVRQNNLATERHLKVRLLPTARLHDPSRQLEGRWVEADAGHWLGAEPALLRRSAT